MRFILLIVFLFFSSASIASTAPKNFIIDTDVGIDDAIAMLYLLQQPEAHVLAITIESNSSAHCIPAYNNVRHILQLTNHTNIPVACGRDTPIQGAHHFPNYILKQSDTLAGLMPEHPNINVPKISAEDLLVKTLSTAQKPVTILAIGSLTNIALALHKDPKIKDKISRIYLMGGAVRVKGNIKDVDQTSTNNAAEWNIYIDPLAAKQVFRSGVPISMIPLDVTNTVLIDENFYNQIKENHKSPPANMVYLLLKRNEEMLKNKIWYFWDPMTAVVSLHPDLVTFETLPISVTLSPENVSGATTIDAKLGTATQVANKIKSDAFKQNLLSGLSP